MVVLPELYFGAEKSPRGVFVGAVQRLSVLPARAQFSLNQRQKDEGF
jgi:hypothetical protein